MVRSWQTQPGIYQSRYTLRHRGQQLLRNRYLCGQPGRISEAYFSANARNGVVKKDGEAFSGGYFPIGTQITLTTESSDSAAYPYFIGWCQSEYGMNGEQFTMG